MKSKGRLMNKATNITLEQAAEYLKSNDDFLILSHANPDGDTFGCSHGLCGALQRIGKRARIECADQMSNRLLFMKEAVKEQDFEPKVIVTVDVADKSLLGNLEKKYGEKVDLAIDHHLSHVPFAKRIYVEDNAAAACEIIYDLAVLLGAKIDAPLAQCIYAGIATDTGCFKFGNTTPTTHIKAAKLMEYGFDCGALNYRLFDMKSKARIALEQKVIEGMEYFAEGKGAIAVLPKSLLESVDTEDINGISAIPRQIEGVEVGIVLKEKENCWKASMRSNNVNVQELCGLFGGGGHIRAAGCSFKNKTPEEIKKEIKEAVTKAIEAL